MKNTGAVLKQTVFCTRKSRILAGFTATAAAVALPQLFHWLGLISGAGALPGQMLLPMHLPVILTGLLAGPLVGVVVGLASPLISYAVSGMPALGLLPFMAVELAGYGLFAGLLMRTRLPAPVKLLAVQVLGRALRAAAVLIAVYGFNSAAVPVSSIWTTLAAGLAGIILQWAVVPLAVFWLRTKLGRENKDAPENEN